MVSLLCGALLLTCSLRGASGLSAAAERHEAPRLMVRRQGLEQEAPAGASACADGLTLENRASIVDDDLQDLNVSLQIAKARAERYQPSAEGLAELKGLTLRVIRDCYDLMNNSVCARDKVAQLAADAPTSDTDPDDAALAERLRKKIKKKVRNMKKASDIEAWSSEELELDQEAEVDPVDPVLTPQIASNAFNYMVAELSDISDAVEGANQANQAIDGGLNDAGNLNKFMDEMSSVTNETGDVIRRAKTLLGKIVSAQNDGAQNDGVGGLIEKNGQKLAASSSSSLMRRESI